MRGESPLRAGDVGSDGGVGAGAVCRAARLANMAITPSTMGLSSKSQASASGSQLRGGRSRMLLMSSRRYWDWSEIEEFALVGASLLHLRQIEGADHPNEGVQFRG